MTVVKILYGVQGTGNGHITRARIMARELSAAGADVDWVFSGRAPEAYFDMDCFGDYRCFQGLTLVTLKGRVFMGKTLIQSNLRQLWRDVKNLDVSGYDLIINDFEPITAWAAKRAGRPVIGLSHQNAFQYRIPKRGNNPAVSLFMRYFAPTDLPIGCHWHHFGQPILPPLIEPSHYPNDNQPGDYLVYLPFGDLNDTLALLTPLTGADFYIYHQDARHEDRGHLHLRPFSREGFQQDLHRCEGVICSAGFELPSEAIQLGKKLLVQPVRKQMEQQSNALALKQLGYAEVSQNLDEAFIAAWLSQPLPAPVRYPNTAQALVQWLLKKDASQLAMGDLGALRDQLWQETRTGDYPALA
ncbi:MJ1255/VC2487 family glycosyltransferase [Marinimicrobium alkaliphilum]|uniref:MJ1255/VC2487 family glycosyltransferase n=1 Tax=Marinimicrobium alkaliphilum TaxID=2202654 RepID=UPI001E30EB12|nr:MJ1255/VC2487 family glycosyltransferase [Marinimicrobium alkaliphilum]